MSSIEIFINDILNGKIGDVIMLKDNVVLDAKFEGPKEALYVGLDKAVDAALLAKTGMMPERVTFAQARYTATLRPLVQSQSIAVGAEAAVSSAEEPRYIGSSSRSIDDALQNAVSRMPEGNKDYDPEKISVSVRRTAEVPYFILPIVVRSMDKTKLAEYTTRAIEQLADTYGNRLNRHPDSVIFTVTHTKKDYKNDTNIPKEGISEKDVRGSVAESSVSIDDAIQTAGKKPRRVKSTIFKQNSEMIVYGFPETQEVAGTFSRIQVQEVTYAVPLVVTGSKSSRLMPPRAASPAGAEPAPLSNLTGLM